MPNPNAIVSTRIRLEAPPEQAPADYLRAQGGLSVELDEGRKVRLDPADPRAPGFAQVLAGLAELRRPVYLEVDPAAGTVTRVEVPAVGHVVSVREVDAGLEVQIDSSHARHLVPRDAPDFEEAERTLREAVARKSPVILTADSAQSVIDIRFFRPGPDDGPVPGLPGYEFALARPSFADLLYRLFRWRYWPWRWWYYRCISPAHAQQVFDAMGATTCNPAAIAAPCIPFLYPRDGCWGRAHEMRRLMVAMGLSPRKVWIEGSLHTPTRNVINCFVNWGWHVAPTLCVRRRRFSWFWWWGQTMVIDPSLFTTPVTVATWKSVQGDPGASLTYTPGSTFWLWPYGPYTQTDPNYVQTAQVLATYRIALQNQVNMDGPPPYANCP